MILKHIFVILKIGFVILKIGTQGWLGIFGANGGDVGRAVGIDIGN
jgi:hypothetical protein